MFILEFLQDPKLRRRAQRALNEGQAVHSIARGLFMGQRGEFRDRAFQDQVHRASCLHLLIAAIGAWNTPHIAAAIEQLRAEGDDVPEEYLAHISPLTWDHVNLLGQYTFNPATARSLEDLRPLRTGAEADGDDAFAA